MKDKIQSKLAEVQKQKEQTMANYNALCGAEQVLLQLINECEADDNEQSSDN